MQELERQTGKTTRYIDGLIQKLFIEKAIVIDGDDVVHGGVKVRNKIFDRVKNRLLTEHGGTLNNFSFKKSEGKITFKTE